MKTDINFLHPYLRLDLIKFFFSGKKLKCYQHLQKIQNKAKDIRSIETKNLNSQDTVYIKASQYEQTLAYPNDLGDTIKAR